jgi:hypothetical protein
MGAATAIVHTGTRRHATVVARTPNTVTCS